MNKSFYLVVTAGVLSASAYLFATQSTATAQSGTRAPQQKAAAYEARFWDWLSKAGYRHWAAPEGEAADQFYPGKSPHGALIKTHVNRTAASHQSELPVGSIVVKENFSPDKKLVAITVMSRAKGFDPSHNDWSYAKYMPNGQVATMRMEGSDKVMRLAGKAKGCIMCHESAAGNDYAYFND